MASTNGLSSRERSGAANCASINGHVSIAFAAHARAVVNFPVRAADRGPGRIGEVVAGEQEDAELANQTDPLVFGSQ